MTSPSRIAYVGYWGRDGEVKYRSITLLIVSSVATGGHVSTLPRPCWVMGFAQIWRVLFGARGLGRAGGQTQATNQRRKAFDSCKLFVYISGFWGSPPLDPRLLAVPTLTSEPGYTTVYSTWLQVRLGQSPKVNLWELLQKDFLQAVCPSCHPTNCILTNELKKWNSIVSTRFTNWNYKSSYSKCTMQFFI